MTRKGWLLAAGLFFLVFLAVAWFGWHSLARSLAMTRLKADFAAAEQALGSRQPRLAARACAAGIMAYQRGLEHRVYYPEISSEYLTAGNCYRQLNQPRAALQCYEEGLRYDPWSISLLTSLGSCRFALGEPRQALAALEKSQAIYPVKKELQPLLRRLRAAFQGETR
ncbi:MAG TPA: tetratricopeptide repeat protein [Proteobacteria bacterium]|nr:tetratricopeptide repeat protein [Pseudomonadota bacterium]